MALKAFRIIKKFFAYTLLTGLILIVLGIAGTYFFQDKIIGLTFEAINERLATKIEVDEDVQLSILDKFPQISIGLKNVRVYENLPGSTDKLAVFNNLYFTFDAFDFFKGRYMINNIYAEGGDVKIKIDKQGNQNYDIFKADSTSESNISFNLKKIKLDDVMVQYINEPIDQYHQVHVKEAESGLQLIEKTWLIGLDGELLVHKIGVGENEYLKDKQIKIKSKQEYHESTSIFRILPSILKVEGSEFTVEGFYEGRKRNEIDLKINAEKSTISTLVSLLPKNVSKELSIYRSTGNVFFKGIIKGFINPEENPLVAIDFGFKNASFYHPDFDKRIENATLTGYYTNGSSHNLTTSLLQLSDVNAFFTGKKFTGNFSLNNFEDPMMVFDLSGSIDAQSLIKFYPVESISAATGLLDFNISFKGKTEDLKTAQGKEKVTAEGEIVVKDLNLKFKNISHPFKNLNGVFTFNKNDLAVKNFTGQMGKSNLLATGTIKNFISKVIFNKEKLTVEADIRSDMINLDELLVSFSDVKNQSEAEEKINPYPYLSGYNFKFNCHIKHVIFRRLHASNLKGDVDLNQPAVLLKNISFNTAGGKIDLNSLINFKSKERIEFNIKSELSSIYVDSVFYIFENFDQNFIIDKNLKGQFTGDAKIFFAMNSDFDINSPTVIAAIDASVINGELNNFGPMKKLSVFVDERELENMKFSHLKNKIIIENSTVTIPEMEIKSNAYNIKVEGTHTFSQLMDYKLNVPLKNFKKKHEHKDKDEAFGAIEEDNRGYSVVFLTIKGTTDNYKIAYDTKKTGLKIKSDLKKEKKELQNLFKKKEKEEEAGNSSTPDEYEFFDF